VSYRESARVRPGLLIRWSSVRVRPPLLVAQRLTSRIPREPDLMANRFPPQQGPRVLRPLRRSLVSQSIACREAGTTSISQSIACREAGTTSMRNTPGRSWRPSSGNGPDLFSRLGAAFSHLPGVANGRHPPGLAIIRSLACDVHDQSRGRPPKLACEASAHPSGGSAARHPGLRQPRHEQLPDREAETPQRLPPRYGVSTSQKWAGVELNH